MQRFDWLLSGYQWWRRKRGGHWEGWIFDYPGSDGWIRVPECSKVTGYRPGMGRGTPQCEEYPL